MSKKEKKLAEDQQNNNVDVENLDNLDALSNEIGLITIDDDPDNSTAIESYESDDDTTTYEMENDRIIKGGGLFIKHELHVGKNTVTDVSQCLFGKKRMTQVNIKDVSFFDVTASWFRKTTGFGYLKQIFVKSIKKEEREWLKQHLKNNGARIGQQGESCKSARLTKIKDLFFNFKKWFLRETLVVSDDGVLFVKPEFRGKKNTFLPFDKMKYVTSEKGFFHKSIRIFGEQNILPKYSFKKKFIKNLLTILKEKGVNSLEGVTVKSSKFMSPKFALSPDTVICGDNEVFYNSKRKKNSIFVVHYDDITNVWKKSREASLPIFRKSLFFKDIYLRILPRNIRMNEKDPNKQAQLAITVILRHVWWYKWKFLLFFSGKLRRIMKRHGVTTKKPSIF